MSKSRLSYTDEDREAFITMAQEIGITPTIKELGYPKAKQTAYKWIKASGVEITLDTLKQKAALMRDFYTTREKQFALQTAFDRIFELIESDVLNASDLHKIATALNRIVMTMQLLENKPTSIEMQQDKVSVALMDQITALKERNELERKEIRDGEEENEESINVQESSI